MDKERLYGCGLSVESLLDYWRNALPEAVDYAELSGTPPGHMDTNLFMKIQMGIL